MTQDITSIIDNRTEFDNQSHPHSLPSGSLGIVHGELELPEECTSWWFLACLPYCPSTDDIAHEAHYLSVTALPYYDGDDELEEFTLDDSFFGKIQTIIRNRDPKAIFNVRLSSHLPFPSENDILEFDCSVERDAYELNPEINFTRINVRQQARESVQKHMKYKDLSALFQLPHELFLEILSHLHSVDLHALRCVNREFRTFLSSPASNTIWRRSFASSSISSTPLCPIDVNGWEWARLLFGSPRCDDCQCTYDYVNPDAAIRMRLCSSCLSNRLRKTPIQAVEQMSLVHDLIIKTFNQCSPINPSYTDPDHFVQADFDNVLQQYGRLQDNIDKRVDGAVIELEHYKTTRRAYVEAQSKHVRECNNWLIEVDRYYRSKIQRKFDHQLILIRKRLRQDGFKDADIAHADHQLRNHLSEECDPQYSCHHKKIARFPNLTRSNWRKTRHRYCEAVEHYAWLRIQKERKDIVERTIQEFKKTTIPISWCYWPPRHVLHGKQPFSNILNPDIKYRNNSSLEAACERGKMLLQSFIDEWLSDVKRHLELEIFFEVDFLPDTDPVDLAVSVFRCLFCPIRSRQGEHQLFGWEDVVIHLRDHPSHNQSDYYQISFSSSGYNTVCIFLQLLNLDSTSTLAVDMDERDDRFICLACGISSRYALNWREAVRHQRLHDEQSWQVLPLRLAVIIKKREASLDPRYTEEAWSCNRCPIHLDTLANRRSVLTHVYNEHGIRQAQENSDFFYMSRSDSDGAICRSHFKMPKHALHQCLHCTLPLKLWSNITMKQHQSDKHRINPPTAGIDYSCIWEGFAQDSSPVPNE